MVTNNDETENHAIKVRDVSGAGIAIGALFVIRTYQEDQMLRRELAGYEAYAQQVRYRLLPGVW